MWCCMINNILSEMKNVHNYNNLIRKVEKYMFLKKYDKMVKLMIVFEQQQM